MSTADRPSSIAFVANLVRVPFTGALVDRARAHANLVAYHQRMMQRFFADRPAIDRAA